jgi:hypothetical protein
VFAGLRTKLDSRVNATSQLGEIFCRWKGTGKEETLRKRSVQKDAWISDLAYVVVSRNGRASRFLVRSSSAMPAGNRMTVLGSGAGTTPAIASVSDFIGF